MVYNGFKTKGGIIDEKENCICFFICASNIVSSRTVFLCGKARQHDEHDEWKRYDEDDGSDEFSSRTKNDEGMQRIHGIL